MNRFFAPQFAVRAIFALAMFLSFSTSSRGEILIDFEDTGLALNTFNNGSSGPLNSGGATFDNFYSPADPLNPIQFPEYWSGWSFSSVANGNTGGFGNQYASKPDGAVSGIRYAVAYLNTQTISEGSFTIPSASIRFGQTVFANSMQVTNTAWTYFDLLDGGGYGRRFGADAFGVLNDAPDLFQLRVLGFLQGQQTGTFVDFALADFRFPDRSADYVVGSWQRVDLASLGMIDELQFQLYSTDYIGYPSFQNPGEIDYFINTNGYFAIDDLSVTAVPEPTSIALMSVASCIAIRRYRRRRKEAGVA